MPRSGPADHASVLRVGGAAAADPERPHAAGPRSRRRQRERPRLHRLRSQSLRARGPRGGGQRRGRRARDPRLASCPHAEAELVDGVIEGFFEADCLILPPDPSVFVIEVPVGPLPAGVYPIHIVDFENRDHLFGVPSLMRDTLRVSDAAGCVPSPTVLCLQDGRFRVEVTWADFQGGSGPGRAIPLPDREDSGLFWFFDPANIELTVKVLDACVVNDHFWVFVASGSTVEYTITVTDTQSDVTRTYGNDLGEVPSLLPDTGAFATCP